MPPKGAEVSGGRFGPNECNKTGPGQRLVVHVPAGDPAGAAAGGLRSARGGRANRSRRVDVRRRTGRDGYEAADTIVKQQDPVLAHMVAHTHTTQPKMGE